MRYLIDGYNLIFRTQSQTCSLQLQRQLTIYELSQKISALDLNVAIVFDAHHTLDDSSRRHYAGLEIHYTGHQQLADDWILEEVIESKNPEQVTVVTCDKQLAWKVRLNGSQVIGVETFINWLTRRYQNQILKEKKPKTAVQQPLPPPKPQKNKQPSDKDVPEDCVDYYLGVFSKNAAEAEPMPKKLPHLKKKKLEEEIPQGKELEENLSDYYEKIFQKRMEGTEEEK